MLKKFKEQGIVFTAASGRSLLSLEQLFADFRDQMAFIAENGSAAVLFNRLAYEQHLSREQYLDIIDHLSKSLIWRIMNMSYLARWCIYSK